MKKTGFTLAEVLITLSIIGVVAMMTLPALTTSVGEQQAKTGLKKGINTLTEAAQMNSAVQGFDYSGFSDADKDKAEEGAYSMGGLLISRVQVNLEKSYFGSSVDVEDDDDDDDDGGDDTQTGGAAATSHNEYTKKVLTGSTSSTPDAKYAVVFFHDGSALVYVPQETVTRGVAMEGAGSGFIAYYDYNGDKGPNKVSYCGTAVTGDQHIGSNSVGVITGTSATEPEASDCNDKKDRNIYDQFPLFLSGQLVRPANSAAAWAVAN